MQTLSNTKLHKIVLFKFKSNITVLCISIRLGYSTLVQNFSCSFALRTYTTVWMYCLTNCSGNPTGSVIGWTELLVCGNCE